MSPVFRIGFVSLVAASVALNVHFLAERQDPDQESRVAASSYDRDSPSSAQPGDISISLDTLIFVSLSNQDLLSRIQKKDFASATPEMQRTVLTTWLEGAFAPVAASLTDSQEDQLIEGLLKSTNELLDERAFNKK